MSNTQSLKNMAYDNAAYVARGNFATVMTAGSGGVSGKFVAHANLLLFGLNAFTTTAGTSTYTATQYYNYSGSSTSATVHVNASQLSLIRITNTASAGVAPSLSTSTIGPFYVDTLFANGTATGQIGAVAQVALNTSTGSAGLNGLAINQGDQIYIVNGTDASSVNLITIDYSVLPLANVVA
jgi:hypothetical protein